MDVTIYPRRLRGTVTPPPSKSMAHRAVVAELLAGRDTFSVPPTLSEDIRATVDCAQALRAASESVLDCGESGSTLRFLIPVALALRGGATFAGRGRLMERPQTPYFDLFDEKGISYRYHDGLLTVRGRLTPGEYRLTGNVSSQFVTGLLFALPLLDGESVIRLTAPLQSAAYVDMTLETLRECGVIVERPDAATFRVPGGQRYRADGLSVEADWSQAAFWYAANFLGNAVEIQGLNPASVQGDRAILAWYRAMESPEPVPPPSLRDTSPAARGRQETCQVCKKASPVSTGEVAQRAGGGSFVAPTEWGRCRGATEGANEGGVSVPEPLEIDLSGIPDLLPPLAAMSARRASATRFVNAGRLRLKESDRLESVAHLLRAFGVGADIGPDWLNVSGNVTPSGVAVDVDGANDHRIVMAAAILATVWDEPVTIQGAEAVNKSYPSFFADYQTLGGDIRGL